MTFAAWLRETLDTFFPNRPVLLLRRQLQQQREMTNELIEVYEQRIRTLIAGIAQREEQIAEARKERDYFRGRAERLELRLLPDPVAKTVRTVGEPVRVGRKTWLEVQREHNEKLAKEAADKAAQKKAESEKLGAPSETQAAS